MTAGARHSSRSLWVAAAVGGTAGAFALAALGGLVLLPYAQPDLKLTGIWDAICSAAGVPRVRSDEAPVAPAFPTSMVVVTSGMLGHPEPESIGRGATLALQCAICHGPSGNSDAQIPTLTGQYASAIFKELEDFRSGARTSAVMTPFAQRLTEQQVVDVAAYYADLPRLPATHPDGEAAPKIVAGGAPMRGIAPCGACHGGIEQKPGSPWLDGQPAAYIGAQLANFAMGTRRNDTSQQMRNVARQMTPAERSAAASYYASLTTIQRAAAP